MLKTNNPIPQGWDKTTLLEITEKIGDGIPFGLQTIKIERLSLSPFGKEVT
jgi:uncharacterized membrane protein YccF (DUF307 family)